MEDYGAINKANWDERVAAHAASPDYHVDEFIADPAYLSEVVRFDLPLLGDVSGLRGVHLQCHIGTDTISLARLGASMTGVDFSGPAVRQARALAEQTGADATFVESDVYEAADAVGPGRLRLRLHRDRRAVLAAEHQPVGQRRGQPAASRRAAVHQGRPSGAVDDRGWPGRRPARRRVPLLRARRADRVRQGGTYVATDMVFEQTITHEWNHGLGEIVTALLDAGMVITGLTEHDSVPWEAQPGQMAEIGGGEWRLTDRPWRLPHSYTLQAVK